MRALATHHAPLAVVGLAASFFQDTPLWMRRKQVVRRVSGGHEVVSRVHDHVPFVNADTQTRHPANRVAALRIVKLISPRLQLSSHPAQYPNGSVQGNKSVKLEVPELGALWNATFSTLESTPPWGADAWIKGLTSTGTRVKHLASSCQKERSSTASSKAEYP